MRFVVILTTLAMFLLMVGTADTQEKEQKKKQPTPQAKVVDDTDPGDPGGLSDEGLNNAGIGSLEPDEDPANDPVETGQRMVIQGMDLQVGALVAEIRATEDEKARKEKMAELRDTVKTTVELRKKYLKQRIARLEKLVASLRKEVEKKDSVDELVKQLLSKPVQTEPGISDPGDVAGDPTDGNTDVAAETAPDTVRDDPAEKKKSKGKTKSKDK